MTPDVRRPIGLPAALVMLVAVYAAGVGAVLFRTDDGPVATWWPAAAIAVALLTLARARWWPLLTLGIVLAGLAANDTAGRPLDVSALFSLANAAEAVVGALVLTRGRRAAARLERTEDVVRLFVAAIAGAAVIATGACLTIAFVAGAEGEIAWSWLQVFAAHGAAVLILVPIALAPRHRAWAAPSWELPVQGAVLTTVTLFVLAPGQELTLTFAPVPVLVWGALRFDVRVMAWQLAIFGSVDTVLTTEGLGAFGTAHARGDIDGLTAGALNQGYLLCVALMVLPLAVTVQHRSDLLARVSADELLFRRNFTESLVGMLLLRAQTRGDDLEILDLNDTAADIIGSGREEVQGRLLGQLIDVRSALADVVPRMVGGELEGWRTDAALLGARGRRVTLALSRLSAEHEAPVFSAQLLDVSQEHETRRRLEVAEQLTSATLDTTGCIIVVTDLAGTIVRVNAATTRITGYAESDLMGRSIWETAIAPFEGHDVEPLLAWPEEADVPVVRERDAVGRAGQKLRLAWSSRAVLDERGVPAYAVMTGTDVTAQRTITGLMNHLMKASFTTALVGIDTDGRTTIFNSGAQHLLGYRPDEVVGQPFHMLLEPEELLRRTATKDPDDALRRLMAGMRAEGESRAQDWTWVSRRGSHRIVSMTLSVAEDAFASQVGFLCVARDVTEQRQGQEMLVAALEKERDAVDRLRALDEAKNDFVSTVSHELRTPVTSIVGYTEMLRDGSVVLPEREQRPLLDTIARNGQRLIVICNDLLLLSGLDSADARSSGEAVDLAGLLGPVEDSIRPLLNGRRLFLDLDASTDPVLVLGDRAQLEQVVANLLSNAVKFTDDGGRIWAQVRSDGDEAVLVVGDTGIGIPLDEQPGLFTKFFRSSTARQRAIQGTGLGLSIVSAIISAHGGRVEVDSAHLSGTTFTVRLPLLPTPRGRDVPERQCAVRPG